MYGPWIRILLWSSHYGPLFIWHYLFYIIFNILLFVVMQIGINWNFLPCICRGSVTELFDDFGMHSEDTFFCSWRKKLLLAAICLLESYLSQNHQTSSSRKRIRTSILWEKKFVAELINGSPTVFPKRLRMDQKTFKLLCSHVKQSILLIESMNVYIEEMIMTCVYIFPIEASNQSRFQREPSCLEVKSIEISPWR